MGLTQFNNYYTQVDMVALGQRNFLSFESSFNLIIGTSNKEINLFDNPYIEFNMYDLDQKFIPKLSENIKMKICKKQDLTKFIDENVAGWYPNALCFEDLE